MPVQPHSGTYLCREKEKNCPYADYQMPQGRKEELLTPSPIKSADIKNTDNAGQVGDKNPDQGAELTE